MRAFEIGGDWRQSLIDGACRSVLPFFICATCKKRIGAPWHTLPALQVPPGLEKLCRRPARLISQEECDRVRQQVAEFNRTGLYIAPMAQIGRFEGVALVKQRHDFLFAGHWAPLIRREAAERLKQIGIELVLGPARLKQGRGFNEDYGALQIGAIPILSEETLKELTCQRCPGCGFYHETNLNASVAGPWKFRAEMKPPGVPLFRIQEATAYIVATEEFVAAVRELNLSGILIKEIGCFI